MTRSNPIRTVSIHGLFHGLFSYFVSFDKKAVKSVGNVQGMDVMYLGGKLLTDTAIRNAEIKGKQYKPYDADGLYVLVKPNGGECWKWDYTFSKRKTLSIGVYPKVSLKDARKARGVASDLLSRHIGPSSYKQQQKIKAEQNADATFAAIAGEYFKKQSTELATTQAQHHHIE